MHPGRTRRHNNAGQLMFIYSLFNCGLAAFRTQIPVFGGENNAGFIIRGVHNTIYINSRRDIAPASAHKHAYPLHLSILPVVFP
jgi:hypothetical protein